jgi:glycosyltransferase involved in cell wall biosynthesis
MPIINDLSIAIITYKRPLELRRCLDSLNTQSHQPKKIIIIDSLAENTNIPQSRNLALQQCHTKYLAFIDDDCVLNKNWVFSAYKSISIHPQLTYVVGNSKLLNKKSYLARLQYNTYKKWFDQHHSFDTKNVIINTNKLKKLEFDINFKIFEDIDFNQQLKESGLMGTYNPKMIVFHPEVSNIIRAIKKNYFRGQYKAKITNKWGNFDNFFPLLPTTKNLIDFILKLSFNLGYKKNPPYLITIVNNHDRGANGERLSVFNNFLLQHHHFVNIINSQLEFEKITSSKKYLLMYGYPLFKYKLFKLIHDRLKINQSSKILIQTLKLRGIILHRLLTKNNTDFAIIQYPEDMMAIINHNRHYKTLYDSPTIYFKELELSNNFSQDTIKSIKLIESMVYKYSDYTSFHWYSYFDLAKKYHLKITNPIILNWGCIPQLKPTSFKNLSKVICLGKLNSYWVNPNLLSSISQKINLDIFSYEVPDKNLYKEPLKYRGFLKDENLLSDYQFGLISITPDDLRSNGFSAKFMLYISFGLPVFCPEWRKDPLLKPATIYYNDNNFEKQFKKYSQKKNWTKKHRAALKIAKKLNWGKTLSPILPIIYQIQNENIN